MPAVHLPRLWRQPEPVRDGSRVPQGVRGKASWHSWGPTGLGARYEPELESGLGNMKLEYGNPNPNPDPHMETRLRRKQKPRPGNVQVQKPKPNPNPDMKTEIRNRNIGPRPKLPGSENIEAKTPTRKSGYRP